jgi:hypothetical protein
MPDRATCYVETLDGAAVVPVLRRWRAGHPRSGVLALVPEKERSRVEQLQEICADERTLLAGGVFPALVVQGHFAEAGAWLLRLDVMPSPVLLELPGDDAGLGPAADALVDRLASQLGDAGDLSLFLLFDAMFRRVGSLLDELYLRLANRVHYMGANAGSETFTPIPCLFDARRVIQGGVLAFTMGRSHGAVLEHGYRVPARLITATSTAGNRIVQIDWRPAFEVYQTMAHLLHGVTIDRENFYRSAVHFPFGIVRANGTIVVRIPVALEEDGSLFCAGEVPPNSVLAMLAAPLVDSMHTVDALVHGLREVEGPLEGRELLLFYCAGRRLHLGVPGAEVEVRELQRRSQAAEVAGALSLGEIGNAREWSYPLFHNATLVVSTWGGP